MANRQHDSTFAIPALLEAARFGAEEHCKCRRKDADATPYINHPLKVANLLTSVGKIDDVEILQAALLHDTVEDAKTKPEEIERRFGRGVRDLVMEVTDDKNLLKAERKRRQVEKAPHLTPRAKVIKLADKIANLSDMVASPPSGWTHERRTAYLEWSNSVIAGCRGHNDSLEALYDWVADEVAGALKRAS